MLDTASEYDVIFFGRYAGRIHFNVAADGWEYEDGWALTAYASGLDPAEFSFFALHPEAAEIPRKIFPVAKEETV